MLCSYLCVTCADGRWSCKTSAGNHK